MLQKLLDKFFPVHFHVRVMQHMKGSNFYCVEYQYGRFPVWEKVKVFLDYSGGLTPIVGSFREAERLAESFKDITNILDFEAIEKEKVCFVSPDRPYEVKNIL